MSTGEHAGGSRGRNAWAAVAVIALAAGAFLNGLRGTFVFDDLGAILNNPDVTLGWSPFAQRSSIETTVSGRPIPTWTLAWNYAWGATDPWGYHVVNIAIHCAAAGILFGLIRRTLSGPVLGPRWADRATVAAACAAAMWAVHPLQTESVTYVVQRVESLCGLFFLLTFYAVVRVTEGGGRWRWAAVGACAAGMATKEVMVTAPIAAVLLDRAFFAGSFRAVWCQRRGLYLMLAATWLLLAAILFSNPRGGSAGAGVPFGWWDYARTQPAVILHYLRLTFWPDRLVLDYSWPVSAAGFATPVQWAAVVGLASAGLYGLARNRAWGFLLFVGLLILAPSSSVYPILDAAFEHRMYLPLAPVAIGTAVVVCRLVAKIRQGGRRADRFTVLLCIPVVALLMWRTVRRNADYADPIGLWQKNLVDGGMDKPRVWQNLSASFLVAGRNAEARDAAIFAIRCSKDYAEAYANLCAACLATGRIDEAIEAGLNAVRIDPNLAAVHLKLSRALSRAGRREEATAHLDAARRLNPSLLEYFASETIVDPVQGSPSMGSTKEANPVRIAP